jgi:hypothetical protein
MASCSRNGVNLCSQRTSSNLCSVLAYSEGSVSCSSPPRVSLEEFDLKYVVSLRFHSGGYEEFYLVGYNAM